MIIELSMKNKTCVHTPHTYSETSKTQSQHRQSEVLSFSSTPVSSDRRYSQQIQNKPYPETEYMQEFGCSH